MGFHYRKDALLDGQINPLTPEVLVYERKDNGKLRLVAVEYFEWAATVNNIAPTAFGRTLLGPQTHGIAPHFELHAWPFNTTRVECSRSGTRASAATRAATIRST